MFNEGGTRMAKLATAVSNWGRMALFCVVGVASGAFAADYRHFDWQEVVGGVWYGTTMPNSFQTGNVVIVTLPSGGSLVVDSHNSDFLAREVIEKAKEVGRGPVRYLVNTHLHQDHVGGNAAFREAFPRMQLIAHRNTCLDVPLKTIPRMEERLGPMRQQLEQVRARRASLADGAPEASALDRRIAGTDLYLQDVKNFKWDMRGQCLDLKPGQAKVITDGARRIEIRYFGRAHSAGDLVVFLPREKVLAIGDLWGENSGHLLTDAGLDGRDGSIVEVPITLGRIRKLDFDIVLSGHNDIMRGKGGIDAAIAGGNKFIAQISERIARGDTVVELLQKMPVVPADAPPFIADRWRMSIIRASEEIDLRRQFGMKPPVNP